MSYRSAIGSALSRAGQFRAFTTAMRNQRDRGIIGRVGERGLIAGG